MYLRYLKASFLIACLSLSACSSAQNLAPVIQVNQVGFYPDSPKMAVFVGTGATDFVVREISSNKIVAKGKLSGERTSQHSGKKSKMADFSTLKKPGRFRVEVGDIKSPEFEIKKAVLRSVATASLKGYYFQRASVALPEKYAGKWTRMGGHWDDEIQIHASAVSSQRPEGFVISSPKGWYDAGDYNKYVVNSGITMGTLMSVYEEFPAYFKTLNTHIPESQNAIPDLLDEVLWNLRWMLSMQDPFDGGVYHKLTNPNFDGIVMPQACKQPRYVVQKNTIAALDFTAVMAQAARVFKKFNKELPGLADSCNTAALKSWDWAVKNPEVLYNQTELNKKFDPDINTGAYGDKNAADEWVWARTELFALTGKPEYLENVQSELSKPFSLPSWNQMRALGQYTIYRFSQNNKSHEKLSAEIQKSVVDYADGLLMGLDQQPYHTVMGKTARDYSWGSSSVAANQGIALLYAFRMTNNKAYLNAAIGNLDYLLGRNATGYSFLTGSGTKQVMHPHHRLSMADEVLEPIPGLLSGGPNPNQQDKCKTYRNNFADESFTDDDCSYASNEIAINWNAPMVFLSAALDAIMSH